MTTTFDAEVQDELDVDPGYALIQAQKAILAAMKLVPMKTLGQRLRHRLLTIAWDAINEASDGRDGDEPYRPYFRQSSEDSNGRL